MGKLIKIIVLAAIVVFLIGFFFGPALVSRALTAALAVPVEVSRVHLKLSPLEAGLYGVKISNPKGYQGKQMALIPEIFIRLNGRELIKGKIHAQKIVLSLENVQVEKTAAGKSNLKDWVDATRKKQQEQSKPKPEPSAKKKAPAPSPKIDEVVITLGTLSYVDYASNPPVQKSIPVKVNRLTLRNVSNAASLVDQIVFQILKQIGFSMIGAQIDMVAANLGTQAQEMLGKAKEAVAGVINEPHQ